MAHEVTLYERDPLAAGLDRLVGLEHLDPGETRVNRWGLIEEGTSFTRRFKAGQLLFAKRRAYQRKAGVPDFDGICSSDLIIIEAKPERLLPELLPFLAQTDTFFEHALRTSSGSLSPRTKWKHLAEYQFRLPPLDRQRELVEVLASIDQAIEQHTSVASMASALSRSLFHWAVRQYKTVPYGEVGEVQVGFPFRSEGFADHGIRLLRGANVGVDQLNWNADDTKYWPDPDLAAFEAYLVHEGDLIVALDRPFIGQGFKVARVGEADAPCLLVQRVARLRPPRGVNGQLLWEWLHSVDLMSHLGLSQRGSAIPHIFVDGLRTAPIPIPPGKEQAALGKRFEAIQGVRDAAAASAESLIALRAWALAYLLSDEGASDGLH